MAIGSAVGGRVGDRVRSPLRLYGLIELLLVVIVIATPLTFRLIGEVYRGIYPALEESPQLLRLVRLALSLLALGPATVLMGATLPILTRHLTRDAHLSLAFGRLYAANTIGAILGTLAAGLVLIELFGLTGALLVGATCSGIAGLGALLLARRHGHVPAAPPSSEALPQARGVSNRVRLALLIAFISGMTSLGYQVTWARLLASGTGNTTYVFTMILGVFLTGIALGAVIFNLLRSRIGNPIRFLAGAQLTVAALAFGSLIWLLNNPNTFVPSRPLDTIGALVGAVLTVVLPVTVVLGVAFPAASASEALFDSPANPSSISPRQPRPGVTPGRSPAPSSPRAARTAHAGGGVRPARPKPGSRRSRRNSRAIGSRTRRLRAGSRPAVSDDSIEPAENTSGPRRSRVTRSPSSPGARQLFLCWDWVCCGKSV